MLNIIYLTWTLNIKSNIWSNREVFTMENVVDTQIGKPFFLYYALRKYNFGLYWPGFFLRLPKYILVHKKINICSYVYMCLGYLYICLNIWMMKIANVYNGSVDSFCLEIIDAFFELKIMQIFLIRYFSIIYLETHGNHYWNCVKSRIWRWFKVK